jgi:MFS family permease
MVYNEVFPLWVVTSPSEGGFEFDSQNIGVLITVCGTISIILQTTVYPIFAEKLGVLRMYKIGVGLIIFASCLTPMVSSVNILKSKAAVWIGLGFVQLLLLISSNWAFVSVFVLINNASYSQQRATVNGLGQTFASLGRLIGPYCGANLFAWSEDNGLNWPFNYYLVFYLIAVISLVSLYVAYMLPRTIERRKREPRVHNYTSHEVR